MSAAINASTQTMKSSEFPLNVGKPAGRLLSGLFLIVGLLGSPFARAQKLDLTPKLLYQLEGDQDGAQFGIGLWALDDVNRDGAKDILVTKSGNVLYDRVYSGRDGLELHRVAYQSTSRSSSFATSPADFAQLSDIDGDRIADFIAGDENGSHGGVAIIFSGRTGAPIRTHLGDDEGLEFFGKETYAMGDLDRDGVLDYAIGGGGDIGGDDIILYSGASGEERARISNRPHSRLRDGIRPLGVKDLDDDGVPDLAILQEGEKGEIVFVSGNLLGTFSFDGIPEEFVLGRYIHSQSLAPGVGCCGTFFNAGDLDGDGADEVISRNRSSRGSLVAISSRELTEVWKTDVDPDQLYWSPEFIVKIGDLNGDGVSELVSGGSAVISGKDGSLLYRLPRPREDSEFGREVAAISDLDDDGILEVAISDRYADDWSGRVLVYSFGPASKVWGPYEPDDPQLTLYTDEADLIVAWPATVIDPTVEISTDLLTWERAFEEPAPANNRFVVPEEKRGRETFFRLRYTPESR